MVLIWTEIKAFLAFVQIKLALPIAEELLIGWQVRVKVFVYLSLSFLRCSCAALSGVIILKN